MTNKEKWIGKMIDSFHSFLDEKGSMTREQLIKEGKTGENLGRAWDLDSGEEEDPDPLPDPTKKLPEEIQVKSLVSKFGRPIFISPIFIPDLLFNKKMRDEDIERDIIPHMVSGEVGNALRFFLAGIWEPYSKKEVEFPYKRNAQGLFDLPDPDRAYQDTRAKINPAWIDMVIRRIKMFASRGIFVGIDLIDNCSLHQKQSHWGFHWMNTLNNNQDCYPEWTSMYHYYEYWPGGADENAHSPAAQRQWYTSGMILEAFYHYAVNVIWSVLTPFERKHVGFNAGNEVCAGFYWHERMKNIIDAATGGPKFPLWKKITSMAQISDWHYYKKETHRFFQYAVHGIGDEAGYEIAKYNLPPGVKFLPSCDGFMWISAEDARRLTKLFLQEGQLGYELLEGVWEQYDKLGQGENYRFDNIKWGPGKAAMSSLKQYMNT